MRAAASEIAAYGMLVDAKDERAADFYQHRGFIARRNAALTLFLPLVTVLAVQRAYQRGRRAVAAVLRATSAEKLASESEKSADQ